jgi:hypothetical protein
MVIILFHMCANISNTFNLRVICAKFVFANMDSVTFRQEHCHKLDMVVLICKPSTWETEAEGSQVQIQPGEFKSGLDYLARPFIKHC